MKSLGTLATVLAVAIAGPAVADDFPSEPLKIIVPFNAGGGSDAIARTFQNAIEAHGLVDVPVVVTNIAGPGGRIGSRQAKDAEPDGHTLLLNHMTLLTSEATGLADYGYRDFEPVAGTGDVCLVVAVQDSSPHETLEDLLTAAHDSPDTLVYGVNLGALNHMGGLLVQNTKPGAAFRFVQIGGDVANYTNLIGGHINATAISAGQFAAGADAGLRGLAILSDERHPALPDVPTAKEQGFDVSFCFQYWWLAPKGTPQERVDVLASIFEKAMDTDMVQKAFEDRRTLPAFLSGDELRSYIAAEFEKVKPVAEQAVAAQ